MMNKKLLVSVAMAAPVAALALSGTPAQAGAATAPAYAISSNAGMVSTAASEDQKTLLEENKEAYERSQQAGMAYKYWLESTFKSIYEKYGEEVAEGEEVHAAYLKASDMLVALGEAMEAEYEAANAEGRPYKFEISKEFDEAFEKAIDDLAATPQRTDNAKAYEASQLAGKVYQDKLDAAVKEIADKYGVGVVDAEEVHEAYLKASDLIVALGEAMENAYETANANVKPYHFTIPASFVEEFEAALDEMMAAADEIGNALREENEKAYETSQLTGMEYQNTLDETLRTIADEYGEEMASCEEVQAAYVKVSDLIVALGVAMTEEFDAANEEGRPYAFIIPESFEQEFDVALDALKATPLKVENAKAYEASQLAGMEYQNKLDAAVKEIADKYGVGVVDAEEVHEAYLKVSDLIVALGDAMENEYESATEEARPFTFIIPESFEQDFDEALEEMKAKAEEIGTALREENDKAYEASLLSGMVYQDTLDETMRAIADEWGEEVADSEEVKDAYVKASDLIVALGEAMEEEHDAANEEGRPYAFMIPESFEQEFDVALDELKAAPLKYENNKAYEASQLAGMEYQKKLDAALVAIADEYGESIAESEEVQAAYVKASDLIVALGEAMEKEYDSANEEGRPYTFIIPESFEQDFDEALEEMKEAVPTAIENARVQYNNDCFDADEKILVDLNQKLIDVWSMILEEYPEYAESEEGFGAYEAINKQLFDMYDAMEAELESVAERGFYTSPVTDTFQDMVNSDIEELKAAAIATGVSSIAAEEGAEYYTIDGIKLTAPVKGQMNIIRRGNKVEKVFVK